MPRIARIIMPGVPHHVTQRGNRRMHVFFEKEDYQYYAFHLGRLSSEMSVKVASYCLMPNHVHLVLIPSDVKGLSRLLADLHRQYSVRINKRMGWQGYLWQGRFYSVPLDDPHIDNTIRYVELNPVRAKLVTLESDYEWSSARVANRGSKFYSGNHDFDLIRKMTLSGNPGPAMLEKYFQKKLETSNGIEDALNGIGGASNGIGDANGLGDTLEFPKY